MPEPGIKRPRSLHLTAEKDHTSICSILLGNKIDYDALDENQKNDVYFTTKTTKYFKSSTFGCVFFLVFRAFGRKPSLENGTELDVLEMSNYLYKNSKMCKIKTPLT